jgi:hypothetical protein
LPDVADLLQLTRSYSSMMTEATAEDQVQWTVGEVEREPDQDGVVEVVFVAVTTKAVERLVVKAEAVVGPWCRAG